MQTMTTIQYYTVTCQLKASNHNTFIPWLCSLPDPSSEIFMLCVDKELRLDAREMPLVEGGVDGAEGRL